MNPWPACQQLKLIQKSPFPLCACRCQTQTGFEENKLPHLYFCALTQSWFRNRSSVPISVVYIILPAKSTFPVVVCHSCTSVSLSVNVLPIAQANLKRTGSCLATGVVFTVSFGSLIGVVLIRHVGFMWRSRSAAYNIDRFFLLSHMHRLTSCVICESSLDDIRGRMNGEWFYKGQSDKAKPWNLLLNALSLFSLSFLSHSLCLSVCLSPPFLRYIYFKCFLGLCQGFISWPHAKSTAVPHREAEDLTSRN